MEKAILRLKELRGEEPQAAFAAKLGLPQQTYSRYECGKSEPPLALLKNIALKFNVSADWLLGLKEKRGGVSATNSTVAAYGSSVTGGDCARCPLMQAAKAAMSSPPSRRARR